MAKDWGKDLLAISAFPNGGVFAIQYVVAASGKERDYRSVYHWATQNLRTQQLSELDLKRLQAAIHELPSESMSPPINRLVIVSFREGTNWITSSYDTDTLPKPMRRIYDIIGERFESKQER